MSCGIMLWMSGCNLCPGLPHGLCISWRFLQGLGIHAHFSLALVDDNTLTIGSVDQIQMLHIQTIPLGETPRYCPKLLHDVRFFSTQTVATTRHVVRTFPTWTPLGPKCVQECGSMLIAVLFIDGERSWNPARVEAWGTKTFGKNHVFWLASNTNLLEPLSLWTSGLESNHIQCSSTSNHGYRNILPTNDFSLRRIAYQESSKTFAVVTVRIDGPSKDKQGTFTPIRPRYNNDIAWK